MRKNAKHEIGFVGQESKHGKLSSNASISIHKQPPTICRNITTTTTMFTWHIHLQRTNIIANDMSMQKENKLSNLFHFHAWVQCFKFRLGAGS